MNKAFGCLGAALLLFSAGANAGQNWTVHEWGTFTSLQDESGNAIGGINTDDEPVPGFVHRLNYFALLKPSEVPGIFFQGAPSCHPDVTLRLETPVIYFHPPAGRTEMESVDVHVAFHGGWLTEFYPYAEPQAPGLSTSNVFQFGPLNSGVESSLSWDHLALDGNWPVTNTTEHVWTSPRAVSAALVRSANGEAEKFLFYRGVAHIDAPLKISRAGGNLVIRSQLENLPIDRPLTIRFLWLVDIQRDGKLAFRALPSLKLDPNKVLAQTAADFAATDFNSDNRERLKASLKAALVSEGLFDDEAQALLNTWELSYFKSAGLRVFFLVPRAWTDYYLPLNVSVPADINRVMVGRIELVTPDQRTALRKLSDFTPQQVEQERGQLGTNYYGRLFINGTNMPTARQVEEWNKQMAQLDSDRKPLSAFMTVPKSYQTYLDLGRFRNALVLEQAKLHPTDGLTNFIAEYRLEAYKPVETSGGL